MPRTTRAPTRRSVQRPGWWTGCQSRTCSWTARLALHWGHARCGLQQQRAAVRRLRTVVPFPAGIVFVLVPTMLAAQGVAVDARGARRSPKTAWFPTVPLAVAVARAVESQRTAWVYHQVTRWSQKIVCFWTLPLLLAKAWASRRAAWVHCQATRRSRKTACVPTVPLAVAVAPQQAAWVHHRATLPLHVLWLQGGRRPLVAALWVARPSPCPRAWFSAHCC